mgnify:CR=1 FL=1
MKKRLLFDFIFLGLLNGINLGMDGSKYFTQKTRALALQALSSPTPSYASKLLTKNIKNKQQQITTPLTPPLLPAITPKPKTELQDSSATSLLPLMWTKNRRFKMPTVCLINLSSSFHHSGHSSR